MLFVLVDLFIYLRGMKYGCDVGVLFKYLNYYLIESSYMYYCM